MLERLFGLSAAGTTVRTEVVAGATTFLTMAYITFVNPQILAVAGMDFGAVFVATCLAAAAGSAQAGATVAATRRMTMRRRFMAPV